MLPRIKVIKYSHGMKVIPGNRRHKDVLLDYCRTLAQWEIVKEPPMYKAVRQMKRVFAGATKDRSEFRFHINQFEELITYLKYAGIERRHIELETLPLHEGEDVEFVMKGDISPYEYQEPIIEFFEQVDPIIKVTNLQTGLGKTMIALLTMFRRKKRTLIQLRGGYVSRWLTDLDGAKALFKFKKGDIMVVRGRDHLLSVINQAKAGDFDPKVVIITNKTLFGLFKEFELNGEDNLYGISPEELCPLLGIGLRIIDEVHEDYHLSFRSDIYCHCPSSIHLSATLVTEDPFRRRMYDIALPMENWYTGVDYDAYIDVKCDMFDTHEPEKLRTTERGRDMYSHGAYEKSIIRNKTMLANYLDIINYVTYLDYIEDWQGGQKCLIFCSLTDMCVLVRDHLRGIYPELEINEFISETDEVILEKSDIIVSTVESCGTAQDIPGLKMSILTRALKKLETNEQVKGRLRKLKKWPDITPIFNYLTNRSVPKHLEYHQAKIEQFEGKVKSHTTVNLPLKL